MVVVDDAASIATEIADNVHIRLGFRFRIVPLAAKVNRSSCLGLIHFHEQYLKKGLAKERQTAGS